TSRQSGTDRHHREATQPTGPAERSPGSTAAASTRGPSPPPTNSLPREPCVTAICHEFRQTAFSLQSRARARLVGPPPSWSSKRQSTNTLCSWRLATVGAQLPQSTCASSSSLRIQNYVV